MPRPSARLARHALRRIPTTTASFCLPSTLCSQCRFLLYSAFWASHRQQNEPNRYSRDKHDLVYQESAPTVLVGADFLLYRKTDRKEICYGKEKSWIRQRHRLHPRRRRQRRGARKPLGLPVQDVAKRRRGLRAHLRRVRAAHRLRDDAQRDLSRPPRAGKPHDRLQDDPQEPRLVRTRGDRDPRVHHLLLLRARRLDDEVRAQLLQRQRRHRRHILRQHGRGHPLHRDLPRAEHDDHHGRRQGRHREGVQGAHAGAVSDPRRHRRLRADARQRRA